MTQPPSPSEQNPTEPSGPNSGFILLSFPAKLGLGMIALFFGGLFLWSALAPIDSAAIASGVVIVESKRKTIKHLEGGIIAEIMIREDEKVKAGQTLLRLDDTQARANLEVLQGRWIATLALQSRLIAERDDLLTVSYPPDLQEARLGEEAKQAMAAQDRIFAVGLEALKGQEAILKQRIAQYEEEIAGLSQQVAAEDTQLELILEELRDKTRLVARGLVRKPELLKLKRQAAEIEGKRGHDWAQIARIGQNIAEVKLQIAELHTKRITEATKEIRDAQTELFDLRSRLLAAADTLNRTTIIAPLDGIIVDLQVNTPGGVVDSGEPLMDIVPRDDNLIIEAKVDPIDIDVVHPGLTAQIRFTALSQKQTLPAEGRVISVSADSLSDDRKEEEYYLTRIHLNENTERVDETLIQPGMQAEVMIVTGTRTPLQYLLRPLTQSFERSFREE